MVSNRKRTERQGKIQLIDATKHFQKMRKSLGNKRNELSDEHINEITRLYAQFRHGDLSEERICSKIFDNREFGYLKITVERPLKLNFQINPERIERFKTETAFINLAETKKRKDAAVIKSEIAEGIKFQKAIITMLSSIASDIVYKNRNEFNQVLQAAINKSGLKLQAPIKKAIFNALSERDDTADRCLDSKGKPEADSELRDTELVPLPRNIPLPLPLDYGDKPDNRQLVELVRDHCESYLQKEVLPHVPDAWIDHSKTKVGYEIPLNRHFYVYQPPRPLEEIEADIKTIEQEILQMLKGIVA